MKPEVAITAMTAFMAVSIWKLMIQHGVLYPFVFYFHARRPSAWRMVVYASKIEVWTAKGTGSRNDGGQIDQFYGARVCAKWTARQIIMRSNLGIPSNWRWERDGSCLLQVLPWKMCEFFPYCQICCLEFLYVSFTCSNTCVFFVLLWWLRRTIRKFLVHATRLEVLPCSDPGGVVGVCWCVMGIQPYSAP